MSANIHNINYDENTGFVRFANRNFSYTGDRGTWVKFDEPSVTLTINKAARGVISRAYESELNEFCSRHGFDFSAMACGTRASVKVDQTEALRQMMVATPANFSSYLGDSCTLSDVDRYHEYLQEHGWTVDMALSSITVHRNGVEMTEREWQESLSECFGD